MALQSSGRITLNDIAVEFGGNTPHNLSEYYGAASGIPGSGTIKFSDFYGKSSGPPPLPNFPRLNGIYAGAGVNLMTYTKTGGGGGGGTRRSIETGFQNKPSNMQGGTTFLWHSFSANRDLFSGSDKIVWSYTTSRRTYTHNPNNTDNLSFNAQCGYGYEGTGSSDLRSDSQPSSMTRENASVREEFGQPNTQLLVSDTSYGNDTDTFTTDYHNLLKASIVAGFAHSSSYPWGDVSHYRNSYSFNVSGKAEDNQINVTVDPMTPYSSSLAPGSQVIVLVTAMIVNRSYQYPMTNNYNSSYAFTEIWGVSGYNMSNIEDSYASWSCFALKYKRQKSSDRLVISFRPYMDQPSNAVMVICVSRCKTGWL